MRGGLLACGACLLAVSATPAAAQARGAPPREGRFRFGPLWLTPRIELRNAGVDTNVFNTTAAPIPDTSVVLRTQLDGYVPVRSRLRLYGTGYTDFNYFRRETTQRSTDFGGAGHAELSLGPFVAFGGGGGAQARQRATIDLDERVLRQEKSAYVGAETHLGSRTTLWGQGSGVVSRYGHAFSATDPFRLARGLDRNTLTATGELRFRLTTLTELLVRAEAIEDRFLQQRDANRVTRSYRAVAGFRFDPLAAVNGTILAGFREIPRSSSGSVPPYRGPVLMADTGIPLFGRARLGITGLRDVVFAATSADEREGRLRNTYVSSRVSGVLELGLPLDLRLRAGTGFEEARYLLPYTLGTRAIRRVDHLYTVSGSLLRQVGDSFSIGGTVLYTRRVSNFATSSYEGYRYGLTAELRP